MAVRAAQSSPAALHQCGGAAAGRRALRRVRHCRDRAHRPSAAAGHAPQAEPGACTRDGFQRRRRAGGHRPGPGHRDLRPAGSRLRHGGVALRYARRAAGGVHHAGAGGVRRAPGGQAVRGRPHRAAAGADWLVSGGGGRRAPGEDQGHRARFDAAGGRAPAPARRRRRVPAAQGLPPHGQRQLVRGQLRRVRQRSQPVRLHTRGVCRRPAARRGVRGDQPRLRGASRCVPASPSPRRPTS